MSVEASFKYVTDPGMAAMVACETQEPQENDVRLHGVYRLENNTMRCGGGALIFEVSVRHHHHSHDLLCTRQQTLSATAPPFFNVGGMGNLRYLLSGHTPQLM